MDSGLTKTVVCLLCIGIGFLLKKKIAKKEHLIGLKVIILSIALPATIFIALLKIEIKPSLIALPFIALGINLLLFASTFLFLKIYGIDRKSPTGRSILLLLASMAPGLSCFPFIIEYLGEQHLAFAAFADVGNKFYGLIFLYLVAMHWYYKIVLTSKSQVQNSNGRIKELCSSLLQEPINIVLVVAIIMLIFGQNFQALPSFMQLSFQKLSVLMTPLVLIYIGLAVKVNKKDISKIINILLWKSGVAFLISGLIISVLPATLSATTLLLVVIFPQSSCSFWPFAHMTAVDQLEKGKDSVKTFDTKFALNLLAFSLPFSTIIILSLCSVGESFVTSPRILSIGLAMLFLPLLINFFKKRSSDLQPEFKHKELSLVKE